ncbi:MAG: DegV family protein [Dehalococcoidales bacterium]|jgi:DegV family protein with EDD domain|nr:DegV family protein [Dehalococcoidales bacterium]MDD4322685.1 DegV family protein [Dehalococcoidales bacterium]MDX9803670.1 DegV family protein [Dehalococcoidales bacterium]
MSIKIVTDSTADIPADIAKQLNITIVPIYILFGTQSYRDGLDISHKTFYERLLGGEQPTTSQPTPQDFIHAYEKVSAGADGICSIHISSGLSGTCNSAVQALNAKSWPCPVNVIDTRLLSISHGIIAIKAAKMAMEGKGLEEITSAVESMMKRVRLLVLFDTLKYLERGGRIGKAKALMGSVLSVKPLLTMRNGEFIPVGQVRNRGKGIQKLADFAADAGEIEEMCILHSTTPNEANALAKRLDPVFPSEKTLVSQLGAGLAPHGGPGVLAIVTLAKEEPAG